VLPGVQPYIDLRIEPVRFLKVADPDYYAGINEHRVRQRGHRSSTFEGSLRATRTGEPYCRHRSPRAVSNSDTTQCFLGFFFEKYSSIVIRWKCFIEIAFPATGLYPLHKPQANWQIAPSGGSFFALGILDVLSGT